MHRKGQGKAERNSPEGFTPECTSGLAAPRMQLWQGADSAEAPWHRARDRTGTSEHLGSGSQKGITDVIRWNSTIQRPCDATAPLFRVAAAVYEVT